MYSFGDSAFSGSTIAPACTPVYSFGDSAFSGSTIAPACTPVYSLGGSTFSGSTIAPDSSSVYAFVSGLFSVALFSCFLSVTFTSVFSFNCGCFLLFCWELTFPFTSSFNFLVSASFFINPTKLYPGIEEILGSLSPTFKL